MLVLLNGNGSACYGQLSIYVEHGNLIIAFNWISTITTTTPITTNTTTATAATTATAITTTPTPPTTTPTTKFNSAIPTPKSV